MKCITRTITYKKYQLGKMNLQKHTFEIMENLTKPFSMTDRAFEKQIKKDFPDLLIVNKFEEEELRGMTIQEFVDHSVPYEDSTGKEKNK